ncbi:MAG: hypothetical protein ACI8TQ_002355 [Planctomycetota bacterium]|jgi:hypothetical protein
MTARFKPLIDLLRRSDDRRLLLSIVLLFIPMAAIGTLLHEAGHIVVAHTLGYEPVLYFDSMSKGPSPFASEADYSNPDDRQRYELESTLITIGGPAQNMLTGTIGFVWLWRLRRKQKRESGSVREGWIWLATLMALFWSRQAFNAIAAIVYGDGEIRGDEFKIAHYFDWPIWSVLAVTGAVSVCICLAVIGLQRRERRIHFAIGMPIGSLIGFALWFKLLGPYLLPH